MKKLVREIPLANGLSVRFYDTSHRYFGDYHKVRVEICCEVPVVPELFQDQTEYQQALKLIGPSARYLRHEEHQGVATADVERVVQGIVEHFAGHSLRYFAGEEFPGRLVRSELERLKKRSTSFAGRHSHV
ncbi:hypothetical protein [Geomesophilobacter sediminis]|uniref:Uncharacterized protein n=1 Tax=Geomesophilobacter sediminis TaxID=2798584 RepID=A0A8J7JHB5_9BACT|nr:hypothetical protein [Geomesophilobacter sediminis]MBJ6723870.1 hypothetical protein [Geomesophilobacter sediminis]